MANTKIEWTEETWNPVTGCDKVSAGCKNCYAKIMTKRLKAMGQEKYKDGFSVRTHEEELKRPFGWRKPRKVFVNSMSDTFHKEVPDEFIEGIRQVIADEENEKHIFQILTKRADRLQDFPNWPDNAWIGVTVENNNARSRIQHLKNVQAPVRFISVEPLLESLPDLGEQLNKNGVNWVIVGGESGTQARDMDVKWIEELVEECKDYNIPIFIKQLGTRWEMEQEGTRGKGEKMENWPEGIRTREYPDAVNN